MYCHILGPIGSIYPLTVVRRSTTAVMTVAPGKANLAGQDAGVHLHRLPQEIFFSPKRPAAAIWGLSW
ncbi:hypothetical protein GEOBRER4_n0563 [Citrifermentans bremense]|uniref:Uncharacterized protein n=1 Tax=Citrifermentans bremense TaxID=60035 RepID=A0A6S6LV65_9BACT|nr:hypothetical protein GEOBRER4_n0563 [Citrifermentans bremense]